MKAKSYRTFNYYFLNKRLHPTTPKGFRKSIAHFIVNKNKGKNHDKVLLISEKSGFWNYPKETIQADNIIDDVITTIMRNFEKELGFKGIVVTETKPLFRVVATLFDFYTQIYDKTRSLVELGRGYPTTGKVYTLVFLEYKGPEKLPMNKDSEVVSFKWVNFEEGLKVIEGNAEMISRVDGFFSEHTVHSNTKLYKKAWKAYLKINKLFKDSDEEQKELFN